jgi:hypothetical protein
MAEISSPHEKIYPLPELSPSQDMQLSTSIEDLELDLMAAVRAESDKTAYLHLKEGLKIHQRWYKEPRPYLDNDGKAAFVAGAVLSAASMVAVALARKRRK